MAAVAPKTTGSHDLGTAALRWGTVYAGDMNALGNVTITGNLNIIGNASEINVDNLTVDEPLIKLANGNSDDLLDIGIFAQYQEGETPKYSVLYRDASDGKWKLATGLTNEPTPGSDIPLAGLEDTTFVVTNLEADALVSASGTDNDLTLTPDGTGSLILSSDLVVVGEGDAAGTVTSSGAQNLVLQTNSGTNSGSITLAAGENGNITLDPDGTGGVTIAGPITASATADTALTVGEDSIYFEDSDGVMKKDALADVISATAGDGLAANAGVLALDLNGLAGAAVDVSADSIAIVDATDSSTKLEAVADVISATAGDGLAANAGVLAVTTGAGLEIDSDAVRISTAAAGDGLTGGGGSALALDLNGLAGAAVDVSADSIAIVDATDSSTKLEAIADVVSATAGTGLTATNGVLSTTPEATGLTSIINSGFTKLGTAGDQEYITFGTANEVNTFVNNTEILSVTSSGADVTGTLTATTVTDGTASITGGAATGFTSLVVDDLTINSTSITSTGNLTLNPTGGSEVVQVSGDINVAGKIIGGDQGIDFDGALVYKESSNTSVASTDHVVFCTGNVTLPNSAFQTAGREIVVVNTNETNSITVTANGGAIYSGGSNISGNNLGSRSSLRVIFNGTDWYAV